MTLRLMDFSIHIQQGSKGAGGVIWCICFSRTGSDSPAPFQKDCSEETPWYTFWLFSHKELFFSSDKIALMEYSTPDPKEFLVASAKMELCEEKRLSHSHMLINTLALGHLAYPELCWQVALTFCGLQARKHLKHWHWGQRSHWFPCHGLRPQQHLCN